MKRYDLVVNNDDFHTLHAVCKNNKWGIFDSRKDEEIVPLKYDDVTIISEDIFAVKLRSKWGAIRKGQVLIPCVYEDVFETDDGFIMAEANGRFSLFSKKTGKSSMPYDKIRRFDYNHAIVQNNLSYGIISKNLEEVIEPRFGCLWYIKDTLYLYFALLNSKYYILDVRDKSLTPTEYSNLYPASSGYFIVEKNKRLGIIFKHSVEVFPPEYTYITQLSDTIFILGVIQDSKIRFGVFDLKKGIILECNYSDISMVGKNNLAVKDSSRKTALFDLKGNQLTDFKYERIDTLANQISITVPKGDGTLLFGLINSEGKELIPPIYEAADTLPFDGAVVKKDGKYGVCEYDASTQTYKLVSKIIYDKVTRINTFNKSGQKFANVELNGIYGQFYW